MPNLLKSKPAWIRDLHATSRRNGTGMAADYIETEVMFDDDAEHIFDDDYPIPYRYCPVNRDGWPSFVMNLPRDRRGPTITLSCDPNGPKGPGGAHHIGYEGGQNDSI